MLNAANLSFARPKNRSSFRFSRDVFFASPSSRALKQKITAEIRLSPNQRMTFARFMEMSLYDRAHGYYSSGKVSIGQGHDFSTHPETMFPVFGYGLAEALSSMWQSMGQPEKFNIVEMGAGNGTMAKGILDYLKKYQPKLYQQSRYTIIEISPALMARQREKLAGHNINHINGSAVAHPLTAVNGVFISNELPDAFPIHRIIYHRDPGKVEEVYVAEKDGKLVEVRGPVSDPRILDYLKMAKEPPADGTRCVVNLKMLEWLTKLNQSLTRGYILTIDYSCRFGKDKDERLIRFFSSRRLGPRTYYTWPGSVDMTADIHSDIYETAAAQGGLKLEFAGSEARFLRIAGAVQDRLPFTALLHSRGIDQPLAASRRLLMRLDGYRTKEILRILALEGARFIERMGGKDFVGQVKAVLANHKDQLRLIPSKFKAELGEEGKVLLDITDPYAQGNMRREKYFAAQRSQWVFYRLTEVFCLEPGVCDYGEADRKLKQAFPELTVEERAILTRLIDEKIDKVLEYICCK